MKNLNIERIPNVLLEKDWIKNTQRNVSNLLNRFNNEWIPEHNKGG